MQNKYNNFTTLLRNFFLWCGGIVPEIWEKCPTEKSKHLAVGIIVPLISLLSLVSFTYFLSHSFKTNFILSLIGGAFWAILVFCLERVILTAYRKGDKSMVSIILRFTLVIVTSTVVGKPIILSLFEGEIVREMKVIANEKVSKEREAIKIRYQEETEKLEKENSEIQSRLDDLKKDRDAKEKAVTEETEGISGSGKSGYGIAAKQKDTAFREADAKYLEYKKDSADAILQNKNRLAEINEEIENTTKEAEELNKNGDGIIARTEALFSIMKKNPLLALLIIPVFLMLILIELIPLTSKVFGKKGVYDEMLEAEETTAINEIKEKKEFETANFARSRELQNLIFKRISRKVSEGKIEEITDPEERRIAEALKTEILEKMEKESFMRIANSIEEEKLGEAIKFEIIGNNDYEFVCQVPKKTQRTLSLKSISGDLAQIKETIGENFRLVKIFTSKMREISASLPLLAQLENDRKILLQFEPIGEI